MNPRTLLLELLDAALRAVDGRACVRHALRHDDPAPVALFAIGKAASSMTLGACDALGSAVRQALLITKDGHVDPEVRRLPLTLTILEAAHPVPDERSLAAGAELERRITALPAGLQPLFLISGGSSSLVEALRPGVSLADLRELNGRGLAAGWDITRLNTERALLSRLKNGGVARLLGEREARALFISDVPGDDPAVIGSGLLGPAPGRADRIVRRVLANAEAAARGATEAARDRGLDMKSGLSRFAGEAEEVARQFVTALRDTRGDGLVWCGESTVTLPAEPGRGGRNQHLALAAARLLRADEPVTLLAAGTDGGDGPTEDAGALVDCGTVERAELAGIDVDLAWRRYDSGAALEAAADLVHTGPTGTNVGDILIGIKQNARRRRDPAASRML